MSGSPKYTSVSAGERRRQQAARERVERERRRREQEQRERAAVLAAAARAASDRLHDAVNRCARVRQEAVNANETGLVSAVDRARADLSTQDRAIASGRDLTAIDAAIRHIEASDRAVADVRTKVIARQRRQVVDRIDGLVALLNETPDRNGYDPAGADAVDQLLDDARRRARTDPADSGTLVEELSSRISSHLQTVRSRCAAREEQQRQAVHAVTELSTRLSGLEVDAQTLGLTLPDGGHLRAGVDALAALVRAGQFAEVLAGAPSVGAGITSAESSLDTSIDGLNERRALLGSIITALPGLGFEVDESSLEETSDGALGLRAYRADGEGFSVLVQPGADSDSEVFYTTDTMLAEAGGSQPVGQACPTLVDVIEALSTEARRDGFEPGAIGWDTDENRPPPRSSVPLPHDSSRSR